MPFAVLHGYRLSLFMFFLSIRKERTKESASFLRGGNSTKDTISNAEGFFACGSSSLAESLFCFQGNKIKEKDNVLCIKSAVLRFLC